MAFAITTHSTELRLSLQGTLVRFGKRRVWIEKSNQWEWRPHTERFGKTREVWFLNVHVITDRT